MKLKLMLATLLSTVLSIQASAVNWTVNSEVSYLRTYDGVTFSIGLKDERCQNEKDYFYVHDRADNQSFYSMALSAMLANKRVRISYVLDANGTHCSVDGIWISP